MEQQAHWIGRTTDLLRVGAFVWATVGITLSLWAGVPAIVRAEPAAPAGAVARYREGRSLYQQGRYREAIVKLKQALALDPDSPNLMYNLARVHELLGNLDESLEYYRGYLDALPDSELGERTEIEATIQRLIGARAEVRAYAASRPLELKDLQSSPPEPPPPGRGRADVAFWMTAVGGAAALIGSGIAGWLALKRENDVVNFVAGDAADGPLSARQKVADQANTLAFGSDIALGVGLAAVSTAALLYFLRDEDAADQAELAATTINLSAGIHPNGASAAAAWRF